MFIGFSFWVTKHIYRKKTFSCQVKKQMSKYSYLEKNKNYITILLFQVFFGDEYIW